MTTSTQATFTQADLPLFNAINPATIESTIKEKLEANLATLDILLADQTPRTWENFMAPLEAMNDELSKDWSPIAHLHAVKETESLRQAYQATLPHLTRYQTTLSQNEALFHAIESIQKSAAFNALSTSQKTVIEHDVRDFKLAGVNLPTEQKEKLAKLQEKLSELTTRFGENLLDATQAFHIHMTDIKDLKGLPEHAIQLAEQNAKARELEGYVLTLDYPSYSTGIRFLENRDLRKQLYEAYVTRASDQGPEAGRFDNTPIMASILATRQDIAATLGFANFATYSLATKMAKTKEDVLHFLEDLVTRSQPFAKKEYAEIVQFALGKDGLTKCESWDLPYYSEQLFQSTFHFSPESLRSFFPISNVLSGLFSIVNRLYGIKIVAQPEIETWHPDVQFFAIYDETDNLRGGFYIDLYARAHKRDGAWMDECRSRRLLASDKIQYPVAYLTCNFMPPVNENPALLTHDDVITLFHEFGHCLHHTLTRIDHPAVGGINGVAWDAVEFPSQFMENFCWEKASLDLIARHYQTGEPLPDALFKKMVDAKHFQSGLQMLRQLEFSIYDFKLHAEYDAQKINQAQTILDDVRQTVAVIQPPSWNRFQHSFAHIFAGSYAAGYYSYKWAEVLSADAYAKFTETGLFNPATGKAFMTNILEVGGSREPMDAFVAFRGRPPTIDALLALHGIQ